jgi:hypothetical protein
MVISIHCSGCLSPSRFPLLHLIGHCSMSRTPKSSTDRSRTRVQASQAHKLTTSQDCMKVMLNFVEFPLILVHLVYKLDSGIHSSFHNHDKKPSLVHIPNSTLSGTHYFDNKTARFSLLVVPIETTMRACCRQHSVRALLDCHLMDVP